MARASNDFPWAGSLAWPLAPFALIVNDLTLPFEGKLVRPPAVFLPGGEMGSEHGIYERYRRYFLLQDESTDTIESFENTAVSLPAAEFSTFNAMFEKLQEIFANLGDPKAIERLIVSCPQIVARDSNLLGSIAWALRYLDLPGNEFLVPHKIDLPQNLNALEAFYLYGEALLSTSELRGTDPSVHAFNELLQLDAITENVQADRNNATGLLVVCSFFADHVPDALLFFPVRTDIDEDATWRIAHAFQGLSRLILEDRQAWLYRWMNKLGGAIDRNLEAALSNWSSCKALTLRGRALRDRVDQFDAKERAKEWAKIFSWEAIAHIAAVLSFADDSKVPSIVDWLSQFSDGEILNAHFQEFWTTVGVETETTLAIGETAPAIHNHRIAKPRQQLIERFISRSWEVTRRSIEALEQGRLKGLLSIKTTADLRSIAFWSPLNARIILVGAPGGGKGAAARDYHEYFLQRTLAGSKGKRSDDFSTAANSKRLPRYLKSVKDSVVDVFRLPAAIDLATLAELRVFFLKQISGTKWWDWPKCTAAVHGCGLECVAYLNTGVLASVPVACNKCPCFKFVGDISLPRPDIADAARLAASAYLLRFHRKLQSCRKAAAARAREESHHKNWEFNLVQVTCGNFGTDGAELLAALRQLFGHVDDKGMPHPGLFQTCAYFGGTLFLDEIADAPVRVQDNLLLALEEGKVSRIGWEAVKEDVSKIRIVAATYKDLREAVKSYRETVHTGRPNGFRPDLLTRLAQNPPVLVEPVSNYFAYQDAVRDRVVYRMEFATLMAALTHEKLAKTGGRTVDAAELQARWQRIYDRIDSFLDDFVRARLSFQPTSESDKRQQATSRISMRFFNSIVDIFCAAKGEDEREAVAYVLDRYVPSMLTYLLEQ